MPKLKVEFDGFDRVLAKLTKLGGDAKKVTEEALRETHSIVTANVENAMAPSNLPAGGKYSEGVTLESLRRSANIEWQGDVASVPVGFDIKKGGLASIFLMYGTPRMSPAKNLYNAFYGTKTRKAVTAAQEEVFWNEIRRLEG